MTTPAPAPEDDQEQAWLRALAGHSLPNEDAAMPHQAQQLRSYFAARDERESAALLSAQSEARMLARLQAQGLLQGRGERRSPIQNGQTPSAPTEPASHAPRRGERRSPTPALAQRIIQVLQSWLPRAPAARYALAGIVLAALAGPLFIAQMRLGQEDYSIKSPPKSLQAAQSVRAQDPAQELEKLRTALQAAGVTTRERQFDTVYALSAQVPPAQRAAVQSALTPWALKLPDDGQLEIVIVP